MAVLLVVLYHVGGWVPGGFVGVDVFFVISGFVITLGLHDELNRTGRLVAPDGTVPTNQAAALEVWEVGLRGVLLPLGDAGIDVLLVRMGAEFDRGPEQSMSIVRPNGIHTCLELDQLEERRGVLIDLERSVAADFPNVEVLDPADYLCQDFCEQRDPDGWLY